MVYQLEKSVLYTDNEKKTPCTAVSTGKSLRGRKTAREWQVWGVGVVRACLTRGPHAEVMPVSSIVATRHSGA